MICEDILKLTEYGMVTGLVPKEDERFTINRLLELFELEELDEDAVAAYQSRTPMGREEAEESLEELLNRLLDYAYEKGILKENSVVYRDLFDTKIMGMLMPRPGEVIHKFQSLYEKDAKAATDYYYTLSQDSNYIRRYRIRRDMKWTAETEFGELDITINLSKPEKDPKAIAAAKLAKQSGYPKCLLCKENEGYAGRVNHPARQNHRIIPVTINHSDWFLQYSPYVYYNEHCIVFNGKHTPMKIEKATFGKLLDFVKQFPHYFVLTSSRVENAELLECFGREMRPQEWNVLSSVPGDELRLYKLTENAKKIPAARRDRMADAAYHIRGISYPYKKTIFAMFVQESVAKLRKKMHLA